MKPKDKSPKVKDIYFYHDPVVTGVNYDLEGDEEVAITLSDGTKWYGWFFTLGAIDKVMKRHQKTGESYNGSFFWATDMIIIDQISKERITGTVKHLIEVEKSFEMFDELEN